MGKLDTIGICRKAGKLIAGFDAVSAETAKPGNKVAGIVISEHLSDKTKKEIAFCCEKHRKPLAVITETLEEIGAVLGKKTGIMAILDEGLYNSINKR